MKHIFIFTYDDYVAYIASDTEDQAKECFDEENMYDNIDIDKGSIEVMSETDMKVQFVYDDNEFDESKAEGEHEGWYNGYPILGTFDILAEMATSPEIVAIQD